MFELNRISPLEATSPYKAPPLHEKIYGVVICQYNGEILYTSPLEWERKEKEEKEQTTRIQHIPKGWAARADKNDIWIGTKMEGVYSIIKKENILIYDERGVKAHIEDIDPENNLIVGSYGVFTDMKGDQLIPFKKIKENKIEHIRSIIYREKERVLLQVRYTTEENKIVLFNIATGKVEEEILDYETTHNYISRTRLVGFKNESPLFISTAYLKYLSLGKERIRGTEIESEGYWHRLEIIYNYSPYLCYVIASGTDVPPTIYEINIKTKKGEKIKELSPETQKIYGVEIIKTKEIHTFINEKINSGNEKNI